MTSPSISRRTLVASALAGAATLALPVRPRAAAPLAELVFHGPPAGPSIVLAHAVARGMFDDLADRVGMNAWRNPDELRAGLTSGSIALSVMPVQAAANLHTRGFPLRLANVMTDGLLYVASGREDIGAVRDLAGRSVAVPFRGDTPEILFSAVLAHHGLDGARDLTITYTGSPIEAMQLLLAGRVDAALTAEPSTTAAVMQGRQAGRDIRRVIDLQLAWGAMSGAAPVLPQAGLALTGAFLETHGDIVPTILSRLEIAVHEVLDDPHGGAANAAQALGMPAALLAASVPHSNLVARSASAARGDIERMLGLMADGDMDRIGGKLPGDDFYL